MSAAIGIDAGSSLVKLAIEHPSGDLQLEKFALHDHERLTARVTAAFPDSVGVTGGGAVTIQRSLGLPSTVLNEFSAWAAGANRLLSVTDPRPDRYLLVSLGTGTSIQRVEGRDAQRVAGTALGGGTVLGLGRLLTGAVDYDEICALAASGSRTRVDLLLSDVYPEGEIALAADMTAASFGRIARDAAAAPSPADAAAGVVQLVAENIALLIGHAVVAHATPIVRIGGSTLHGNALLADTLTSLLNRFGCDARIIADGAYTGAVGALELSRSAG